MSISKCSSIDSQFAIFTLPISKSRYSSFNINSLYEIEYVPGDQLPENTLPLVNPYKYFAKKTSAFSVKGVHELIKPYSNRRVMEYVQSSKFSSCQVPATPNSLEETQGSTSTDQSNYARKSVVATLHHHIVYRIQDHALNLVFPSSDEALYLEVSSASQAPNSVHIPRQISREELLRRLPESWVTSYEKLHQATQSTIQSSKVSFHSRNNRKTEIKFEKPLLSSFRKQLFTQFAIQIDERDFYGPTKQQVPKRISFEADYKFDEDIYRRWRKKKQPLYKRYLEGDILIGPLGEGKYDFIVQYYDIKEEPKQQIMMDAKSSREGPQLENKEFIRPEPTFINDKP
ncbi:hypothetical protein N665_0749s0014 [Sinapis alba]|nr:hypothetical protein N665_0749s0014 [Sinapis alba]